MWVKPSSPDGPDDRRGHHFRVVGVTTCMGEMMKFATTFGIVLTIFVLISSNYVVAQERAESQSQRKFDAFGNINCEDELARLDAFYVELQKTPSLQGYIVMYGGQ